jgi:gluconolactonase
MSGASILAIGLQFPEGPIALQDGSVLLVEIARQTLSRVRPDGRVEVVAQVPGGPNGAALGPDGRVYICNNGGVVWVDEGGRLRPTTQAPGYRSGSIEIVDPATGTVDRLYARCDGQLLRGPNDLVFDGGDGFWFTDMGKRRPDALDRGAVYWARTDGTEIRKVIAPLLTPNGIGLSPDGKTLYVAETDTARLWAWDICGPGQVRHLPWPAPGGGRIVAGLGGYRRFDSLAVAASGNICVAALESGAVAEITPAGEHLFDHPFDDLAVSNICFGGADLRTAYVTLSHAGALAMRTWHEPGLRLHWQPALDDITQRQSRSPPA